MNIKWIIIILVIIVIIVCLYSSQHLYKQFKSAALEGLERTGMLENEIITERDLAHLPEPVQKYLRYGDVVGK